LGRLTRAPREHVPITTSLKLPILRKAYTLVTMDPVLDQSSLTFYMVTQTPRRSSRSQTSFHCQVVLRYVRTVKSSPRLE
jgi:hypothetical protein